MSPEVGVLDQDAFDRLMDESTDEALSLLAAMTQATDRSLREAATRLAQRIMVEWPSPRMHTRRAVGRLRTRRGADGTGDLDIERSFDALVADPTHRDPNDLFTSEFHRGRLSVCLLIDRSGSMAGDRLATAALAAAAAVSQLSNARPTADIIVAAFANDVIAVHSPERHRSPAEVVDDILRLRGSGITDLSRALTAAKSLLANEPADRRLAVLLSDCRATGGGDAVAAAARLEELAILAPADDPADAQALAASIGARIELLRAPGDAPRALSSLIASD